MIIRGKGTSFFIRNKQVDTNRARNKEPPTNHEPVPLGILSSSMNRLFILPVTYYSVASCIP